MNSNMNEQMRKLWSDHVFYTRLVIEEAIYGSPLLTDTVNRLLKNQDDIGNLFSTIYGAKVGNLVSRLLREHISIFGDYLKSKDTKTRNDLVSKWFDNATNIGDALYSLGIGSREDLYNMLDTHLKLTLQEYQQILNKKYKDSISTFDKIYNEILQMADAITLGMSK